MMVLYFWIDISLGFVCYDGILWHHILFIISIETLSRKPQKTKKYFCIKILILYGSTPLGFSVKGRCILSYFYKKYIILEI